MKLKAPQVVIVGTGHLAWHLALGLHKYFQLTVYNHRKNERFKQFKAMGCQVTIQRHEIPLNADYYFICVKDSSIETELKALKTDSKAVVAHTSGGIDLKLGKNQGVFYPLQTFTAGTEVVWKHVPIFITAENKRIQTKLKSIAELLGSESAIISHKARHQLHLAAVFAANFTNALWVVANDLTGKKFRHLRPLMLTTLQKTVSLSPREAQTGPAKRHDQATMDHHLKLLRKHKDLQKIYQILSHLIMTQQK